LEWMICIAVVRGSKDKVGRCRSACQARDDADRG